MGDTARVWLGFGLAGGVLLVVADYSPKFALGLAGLLALGVALSHSQQIALALNGFAHATGH